MTKDDIRRMRDTHRQQMYFDESRCIYCDEDWPCDVDMLLNEREAATRVIAAVQARRAAHEAVLNRGFSDDGSYEMWKDAEVAELAALAEWEKVTNG